MLWPCVRPSVCLTVTSRHCIETTGRIELASYQRSYIVLLGISKNEDTFLWDLVTNSEHFATARRPRCQQNSSSSPSTAEFVDDTYMTVDDLLRICYPYLDSKTASTIATSIVHSKLDYCNSLYHNLPKCQITRLQQIQNSLASAVVRAPKSSHITRSLHWLKTTERIEYKLLSLTYKVLTTTPPSYMHNLITVQPPRSTRSSSLVTLARPSTLSSVRIIDRSFQYASPRSGISSRLFFCQPRTNLPNSDSIGPTSGTSFIGSVDSHCHHPSPLHSFIPGLKPSFSANPSHRSLPGIPWTVYRYF